ncbi:MAG: SAM-dependent methyltransferase [Betaproteobacteria bacterium]|nr:SAM-dependent methyltransferase [Betaproteobacteria bacterium]MDH5578373.1 SAM-dependent methyltransferase [Betaproteobacteria bacterium]
MRALALALLAPLLAFGQDQPVDAGPYVPSPQSVVSDMLKLAEVGPEDFVIDLGSGDGRIVRTAALIFGARGFGVEIKDELVRQSNADAEREGIAARVKFIKADLFKTDISQATVLTMYLLPDTVNLLRDKLLGELRPGTRILSHDYPLSGWIPEKYVQMDLEDKVKISGVTTTLIYLYVVPAKVEGRWTASAPGGALTLNLKQQITRVSGTARTGGKDVTLEDVKLRGERLSFRLAGRTYSARVRGAALEGEIAGGGAWSAKRAR